MNIFLSLIILLGIQICIVEFTRKKGFKYDFFSVLNFIYVLVYVVTPLYYTAQSEISINDATESLFYSILGYQFILAGWILGQKKRNKTRILNDDQKIKIDKKWIIISIYAFWISIISFTILTISRGGISNAIAQGALSRYSIEEVESSSFAFLSRIVALLPFLSLIFFYFFLKRKEFSYPNKILFYFYFSLSMSVLQAFISASRGGLLRIFLMYLLLTTLLKANINFKKLIFFCVFFVLFVSYGKQTFYAVSNYFYSGESISESFNYLNDARKTDEQSKGDLIFREFSHPSLSINAAVKYNEVDGRYTYFRDFTWSILRIIPQRLTTFLDRPEPINVINTHQLRNNFGGGIPPGLIASFYYSLGTIGVVLGGLFYGYLGRYLNDILIVKINSSPLYLTFFIYFSFFYGFFVTNGDPNVYIYYIIFPALLIFIGNKSLKFR